MIDRHERRTTVSYVTQTRNHDAKEPVYVKNMPLNPAFERVFFMFRDVER